MTNVGRLCCWVMLVLSIVMVICFSAVAGMSINQQKMHVALVCIGVAVTNFSNCYMFGEPILSNNMTFKHWAKTKWINVKLQWWMFSHQLGFAK